MTQNPMFDTLAGRLRCVGWRLISDGWRAMRQRREARG